MAELEEKTLLRFPLPNCPAYEKLLKETWESTEYKKRFAAYKDFIDQIQPKTGFKPEEMTLRQLAKLQDTLFCEEIHKFPLPEWVNTDVKSKLEELSLLSMQAPFKIYKQEEKSRLQGGVLVNAILKNISQNAQHISKQQKMIIYSAHDTTVAALQIALNVFNDKTPPYSACHIFELYEDNGTYQIGMFYRNDSAAEPYEITLPDCTAPCPLERFIQLTSNIISNDWEKECKINNSPDKHKGVITGLAITICVLFLIIFGLLYFLCKRISIRLNNFERI
ncbi:prostatic acid phosphatase-like [Protopterus annectens]|uniref:prostatic acid phosphatase-like n=1 Tax=Protopterus annectens TaxID=7888 RepID=UPI001CFA4256|nr:prostatic acid phosphatase-like [Protopterus annectens]